MPKVSIIMPVYNGEEYLREAIDSIIAQTFTDWEFIIVNEYGSNAAATAILREYEKKDKRIHVIQNQTRLRIAESLNVALRAAKGEYIARMDGDDICGSNRLEKQLIFLDEHPDVDVCGIEVSMFGDNTWDWKVYCQPEYLQCACLFYTPCVHPTVMMRATSLHAYQLEYDRRFTYTEDFDFFVRASEFLRFENIKDRNLYRYRFTASNATNVGGPQGVTFQYEVMTRTFAGYNLELTPDEIALLSPNTNQNLRTTDMALRHLEELDLLLKKVFLHKELQEKFGLSLLFRVLHRRWMDAYEQVRWTDCVMEDGQVQRAIDRGLFRREDFWNPRHSLSTSNVPTVSIVVPTYNSEDYIMDTIYSLLEQEYWDFELLVLNELGSDDRTVECISLFKDPRIRVIQNTERLGLAKSLNRGIREARGKYIARADADDVYPKTRLGKQVEFMDNHPEIGVCGSWQRHFGQRNYIHTPPASPEDMKANLLFKCEVCHSTLMLRREDFIRHDLWYDDSYLSEDYELWCRASTKVGFATIPEVLGEYRWNGDNITVQKMDRLDLEAQKLVARNLKTHLGMKIANKDLILLSGWKNPFYDSNPDYVQLREREAALLDAITEKNNKVRAFDAAALKKVLDQRRAWAFIEGTPVQAEPNIIYEIYEAPVKTGMKRRIKSLLKKMLKPLYRPFRHRYEDRLIAIEQSGWKQEGMIAHLQQKVSDLDGHTYDCCRVLQETLGALRKQLEMLQEFQGKTQQEMTTLQELVNKCDASIRESVETIREIADSRAELTELRLTEVIDSRTEQSVQMISQTTDARVQKAEETINQTTDTRVWKSEELINQTMDTRVWKAEQLINQTTDARVWKAEESINRTMDARVWKAEESLNRTIDERVWKAEVLLADDGSQIDGVHRHIDVAYRDLMVMLENSSNFLSVEGIQLETENPVAYESLDHLHPHGTKQDNTRYPRFVEKCEKILAPKKNLAFLDLGCSGGGMVLDAALRGHLSMGLEGSNYSQIAQRAEWRLLRNNLKTCDITKPFTLRNANGLVQQFDIISAWEVMEHIAEDDLSQMLQNIRKHLLPGGYFVASIANWADIDPETGVNWHVTLHPYEWWVERFESEGFEVCSELLDTIDLARGGYNPPCCYEKPYSDVNPETTFHIVVRKGE